jgi:TonB family protein
MKTKLSIGISLLLLTGCSYLLGSPTATVRKFLDEAKNGNVDAMSKLFSSKAIQNIGAEKIKSNNQQFADMSKRAHARSKYRMDQLKETRTGDTSVVSFFYKNEDGTDSVKFVFALSKEGGAWKIDDIGGSEKEETTLLDKPVAEPVASIPDPPALSREVSRNSNGNSSQPRAPISGGVLNGKATYLPKPAYPPIAKTVKASGTVNVQVTVDEQGDVISATAVSGHPLLRAAAIAAAKQARFSPTRLSGTPVKVTGILTYNFIAE